MPVIPPIQRIRSEVREFKASPGYIERKGRKEEKREGGRKENLLTNRRGMERDRKG
jgi:hypothetical protein